MTEVPKLNGVWIHDKERSDGDADHMQLCETGVLMKQAIKAFKGLQLTIVPGETFTFTNLTIIPALKVSEKYPLSGEPVNLKRRDARKGVFKASCKWIPGSDEVLIEYSWTGYLEGSGQDLIKLVSDDELTVTTKMQNKNGAITNTKVYNRKK